MLISVFKLSLIYLICVCACVWRSESENALALYNQSGRRWQSDKARCQEQFVAVCLIWTPHSTRRAEDEISDKGLSRMNKNPF